MVQGILFDSGGVLIRPVGGRWNPRYDFEEIVLAHYPWVDRWYTHIRRGDLRSSRSGT